MSATGEAVITAKVQKYPHWVLLVVFLPILCSRLLRAVVPSQAIAPLLLGPRALFSSVAAAVLCIAVGSFTL